MANKVLVGANGAQIIALTPVEEAQRAIDEAEEAERQAIDDAETMRVATFADDPEVTEGLTAIKGGTAQDIDAYVASVITLTATDIDTLRDEVETALRAILRRQLKVQFDPTALLGQLDAASQAATAMRAGKPYSRRR